MSRKGVKSAFMLFVQDFKEEQKKKGIIYNHINEAINAADPVWRDASPEQRSKYEKMVQVQKHKTKSTETKLTSTGIPISLIQKAEKEHLEKQELERTDITNMVNSGVITNSLLSMDMYIMDVNSYCKIDQNYIIGECTVLRFNINDGIKDTYHEMINPGAPPMGYSYEVRVGATSLGLEIPDEDLPQANYLKILANIIDYLKVPDREAATLPPIFALPDKVPQVYNFILQLCTKAREDESMFRVYKLELLLFQLLQALQPGALPRESLAALRLRSDPFKYTPNIACQHHNAGEVPTECSQARAKRGAFTVLDSCCAAAGLAPRVGKHLPLDYDVKSIETYQEQKREQPGPSVAGCAAGPSRAPSAASDADAAADSLRSLRLSRGQRAPVQLRPAVDYSYMTRAAPELSEEEFPALGRPRYASRGGARGRGRK